MSVRGALAAIESPTFWRVFYWVLDRRIVVRLGATACRATASRMRPEIQAVDIAERWSHFFLTGWPHHPGTPWINLNVARFVSRIKRELAGARPVATRTVRASTRLNVGLLANLSSTLSFSPPFFAAVPANVDLFAFDLGGSTRSAGYLESCVARYHAFDRRQTPEIISAIEAADLDLLLLDVYKSDTYAILDGLDVPCVADLGSTVNIVFHPNVSFRVYCLQQADYLVRDNRLFCATSQSVVDRQVVYPGAFCFERRGLDPEQRRSWQDREPLLVYHGKLYKLSGQYLDTVFSLLAADSELRFVVLGRDDGHLERVNAAARRHGVADRFHYEGEFRMARDANGEVVDPSWLRVAELLGLARLAPDPWPLGGGYSRVEAYLAGAPVVHMGVRTDPASWRRPQPAVTADQPALQIDAATVYRVADYSERARRLLYDQRFADDLAQQQVDVALRLVDGAAYWQQILDRYEDWLTAAGKVPRPNQPSPLT